MVYLAQLNENDVCIGIKQTIEMINDGKHVVIDSYNDDYMYRKYENGQWSTEKYIPDSNQIKLTEFEEMKQRQELLQEALDELLLNGGM